MNSTHFKYDMTEGSINQPVYNKNQEREFEEHDERKHTQPNYDSLNVLGTFETQESTPDESACLYMTNSSSISKNSTKQSIQGFVDTQAYIPEKPLDDQYRERQYMEYVPNNNPYQGFSYTEDGISRHEDISSSKRYMPYRTVYGVSSQYAPTVSSLPYQQTNNSEDSFWSPLSSFPQQDYSAYTHTPYSFSSMALPSQNFGVETQRENESNIHSSDTPSASSLTFTSTESFRSPSTHTSSSVPFSRSASVLLRSHSQSSQQDNSEGVSLTYLQSSLRSLTSSSSSHHYPISLPFRDLSSVQEYIPPSVKALVTTGVKSKTKDNEKTYPQNTNIPVGEDESSLRMADSNDKSVANPNSGQKRGGGRRKSGRVTDSNSQLLKIETDRIDSDNRTTIMIRNIPNSFTQTVLLKIVNGYIADKFDFFYLPIDFHTQCNLGYCYINVIDVHAVLDLYLHFHNKHWPNTPSQKTCQICYARIQGMDQMLEHSKDWAVMHLPEQFRPLFYQRVVHNIDGKRQMVMQRMTPDVEMRMR